jgi:sulfoxide reductase catalytic subunit YedY
MAIRIPPSWEIPERDVTPEAAYATRRRFLRLLAVGGLAAPALSGARLLFAGERGAEGGAFDTLRVPTADLYPARRNGKYTLDRPLTEEAVAARHNIFDEFTLDRARVWEVARAFRSRPWTIAVRGLVQKPLTLDVDDLIRKMGLEERVYRLRCVETWAMAVPWTGFPFRRFLDSIRPLGSARFVRMVSFDRPEEAAGWFASRRRFPYYEALTLDEASHDLAFLATGIYGHSLPNQHGAPIRLVVPWKFGFKSIKSIVRFELTAERPPTFWSDLSPQKYTFEANVDPAVPRPWPQDEERMLGTGELRKTLPYNGYAAEVARLYA